MEVRQSISPVYSQAFIERLATAFGTNPAAALILAPEVHLIKDPAFVPAPDKVPADYAAVEADFTDYVAKALTMSGSINLGSWVEGVNGVVTFNMPTDPTVIGNTICGYWIEDASDVIAAEMFPEADFVQMGAPGDQLILVAAMPIQAFQSLEGSV